MSYFTRRLCLCNAGFNTVWDVLLSMYTDSDCIAALQLTGWIYGKDVRDVTVTEYRDAGFSPTYQTITNRFGNWTAAKEEAQCSNQAIPSHLCQYFRSVSALRLARDRSGHPVTGLEYQNELDIEVSYHDILSPFRSWTHAKRVAGIHNP